MNNKNGIISEAKRIFNTELDIKDKVMFPYILRGLGAVNRLFFLFISKNRKL